MQWIIMGLLYFNWNITPNYLKSLTLYIQKWLPFKEIMQNGKTLDHGIRRDKKKFNIG